MNSLESEATPRAPKDFVHDCLHTLERDFRHALLLALAEWQDLPIATDETFEAIGRLQRPSWGAWNGLLNAFATARKRWMQEGSNEVKSRLQNLKAVEALLALRRRVVPAELVEPLQALAKRLRVPLTRRSRWAVLFSLPIVLRNRIAHDAPSVEDWWKAVAEELSPLNAYHAEHAPLALGMPSGPWPSPWFLENEDGLWSFNGFEKDYTPIFVSPRGLSQHRPDLSVSLFESFQKLLGQHQARKEDFRSLLGKLAPEDLKGLMMGDYLVGALVGEGGYATVHLGRQLSTGRKVAVKVLRGGLSEDAQERFRQEARLLGLLDHPHIVKVLDAGSEIWSAPRQFSLTGEQWFVDHFKDGARRRHFLVLEWLDGETLEAHVSRRAKKAATPDALLSEWFAQAASALGAVHASGLIHRDVKPSNFMISGGALKLMDFGIARSQSEDRTLLTETGAAIGTRPYMSPEQLIAKDAESEVGPLSDLYSLCATFYELFTGRRLYDHNRKSADAVRIDKVGGRPPPRMRALRRGLSWEIEALVMGGLECEASDRPSSMPLLEADIRRAVAFLPLTYRRPSPLRRGRLFYRRHRLLANTVAGFLCLVALLTGLYIGSLKAEQARTDRQRLEALREKERAEKGERIALEAMGTLVYDVSQELNHIPGLQLRQMRTRFLKKVGGLLKELEPSALRKDNVSVNAASARIEIGRIRKVHGDLDGALAAFNECLAISRKLAAGDRASQTFQSNLTTALMSVGGVLQLQGKNDEALRAYSEVLNIQRQLLKEAPGTPRYQWGLAQALEEVGSLELLRVENQAALKAFEECIAIKRRLLKSGKSPADRKLSFALSLPELGEARKIAGDLPAAGRAFKESIDILRQLEKRDPKNYGIQTSLATSISRLAEIRQAQGNTLEALEAYEQSLAIQRRVAAADPTNTLNRRNLSVQLNTIGKALIANQEFAKAQKGFEESLAIARDLARLDPTDQVAKRDLCTSLMRLGECRNFLGDFKRSVACLEEAEKIGRGLVASNGDDLGNRRLLSVALYYLGESLSTKGDWQRALEIFVESLGIDRRLARADPENARAQRDLAMSLSRVAGLHLRQRRLPEARPLLEEALTIFRRLSKRDPSDVQYRNDIANVLARLGDLKMFEGDSEGARALIGQSLAIVRSIAEAEPGNSWAQSSYVGTLGKLGLVFLVEGKFDEGLETSLKALASCRPLAKGDPDNLGLQHSLSRVLHQVGDLHSLRRDPKKALAAHEEGLGIDRRIASKDRNNPQYMKALDSSLSKVIDLRQINGDLQGSVEARKERLDVLRRLVSWSPNDVDALQDLAMLLGALSIAQRGAGRHEQAINTIKECLAIDRRLLASKPGDPQIRYRIVAGHVSLCEAFRGLKRQSEALRTLEEGLVICREEVARRPEDFMFEYGLFSGLQLAARLCVELGDLEGAEKNHTESLARVRRFAAHNSENPLAKNSLASVLALFGDFLRQGGRLKRASAYLEEAIEILETLAPQSERAAQELRAHRKVLQETRNALIARGDRGELGDTRTAADHLALARANVKRGEDLLAFEHYRKHIALSDNNPKTRDLYLAARTAARAAAKADGERAKEVKAQALSWLKAWFKRAQNQFKVLLDLAREADASPQELESQQQFSDSLFEAQRDEPDFEILRSEPDFQALFSEK